MTDPISRMILEKLEVNCRTSLQDLAKSTGISANDVKRRIEDLVKSGIIQNFVVIPSPLMTNENRVITILEFSNEPEERKLLRTLRFNPSVYRVSRLIDGRYIVYGIYFERKELVTLTSFLRTLDGINEVELYSRFKHYWGGKIELTNTHRGILRCLISDPRMSISDIAKETGFLTSDIKRSIDHMRESETALFTIRKNEDMNEGRAEVLLKLQWNVSQTSHENILSWLQDNFGSLRLDEYVSAAEPTLFFHFLVNHVQDAQIILKKVGESGLVVFVEPFMILSSTDFSDPRVRRMEEMLTETGFSK